jgi:hypothetical protein
MSHRLDSLLESRADFLEQGEHSAHVAPALGDQPFREMAQHEVVEAAQVQRELAPLVVVERARQLGSS